MMHQINAAVQAAVDATSIFRDQGHSDTTELVKRLRDELAQRDIQTEDQGWLEKTVDHILADPNFMTDDSPSDVGNP
ncbi:hypothetical protein [Nocardioides pacificus]